jgi:hypothetical protein
MWMLLSSVGWLGCNDTAVTAETGDTAETGELECGVCPTSWTHVGDLEIDPTNIDELPPCLGGVDGDLTIEDITNPAQFDTFRDLEWISQKLTIHNSTLSDLEPFGCVQTLGQLSVSNNDMLTSLVGLDRITSLNELGIYDSDTLSSLTGLDQLSTVGTVEISSAPALTDIAALSGLDLLVRLSVRETGITALPQLENITSLDHLDLRSNPSLASLAGLERVVTINGDVYMGGSNLLVDLTGLASLTQVVGGMSFTGLPMLSSLAGLEQLTRIGGRFSLGTCSTSGDIVSGCAITSLAGLDALIEVGGLEIVANEQLGTLAGAPSLSLVGADGVRLHDNLIPAANALPFVDNLMVLGDTSVCDSADCTWCSFAP